MKYKTMRSGEWFPIDQGHKIACCTCGLTHNFYYRKRKGQTELRAVCNNRSTGQIRRHMKRGKE